MAAALAVWRLGMLLPLPGRYAPMDAGGALFDALARDMAEIEEGEEKADE